jgi:hypothetical protein
MTNVSNTNIALVDSLMGIFGYTRVTTDEEIAKMEEAQERKDEDARLERGEVSTQPQPKLIVGDHAYIEGTYREVTNVVWEDDHYEYETRPYCSRMVHEDEIV